MIASEVREMLSFIDGNPTAYHTTAAVRDILLKAGFAELLESRKWALEPGKDYFVCRNGSSIIAFRMGDQLENYSFNVAAAHTDSPCFRIKENAEIHMGQNYTKLNTEGYGGMICATWMDRPLSVAGRVLVQENGTIVSRLVALDRDLLLDDMRETMIAADGVGLAGPQVGMMRRLFVVWDTTDAPEEIPEDYEYKFIDFVNPEILAVSEEEETAYEGCLSFPGHNGAVTRPVAVKVRAQDRNGEWFELEADGLLGRCIQHENDHLDGITIMESSEYFYEDTEEGKKAAREAKGNN